MPKKSVFVFIDVVIKTKAKNDIDYYGITDIARHINVIDPYCVIANEIRNCKTFLFLDLWDKLFNTIFIQQMKVMEENSNWVY